MAASRRGWMLPATTSDQFGNVDVSALDPIDLATKNPTRPEAFAAVRGLETRQPPKGR